MTTPRGTETATDLAAATADLAALRAALGSVVLGQQTVIDQLLCAVLAGGHVLLQGLPGLGKTQLVKALARALDVRMSRVQCTPDLMPADVTGSEILTREHAAEALHFMPGPVFAQMVLVDEINRATPKTQSALLEAMQEGQVTCNGRTHTLPEPFRVVATQNPIEIEGTYPLPEAQLDRFAVRLDVDMPDRETLVAMLDVSLDAEPVETLAPALTPERLQLLLASARAPEIADSVKRAAADLVLATHGGVETPAAGLRYGASPRGLQALLRCARVHALLEGRAHVAFRDLETFALPCLNHRVVLSMDAVLGGADQATVLRELLARWRARWYGDG